MDANTDRVPIAELKQRYGQRKFYAEYVPVLGITIEKEGRSGFVSAEDAKLLEQYHQARGQGTKAKEEFLARLERVPEFVPAAMPTAVNYAPAQRQEVAVQAKHRYVPERVGLLGTAAPAPFDLLKIASELESMPRLARWLATHMVLQEAAWSGLVIPKEILLILFEVKRLPPCKDNKLYRYGFEFIGNEKKAEWLVRLTNS